MHDWLDFLIDHRNNSTPCVLVTVVETSGSVPRGAGAKMVVSMAASAGTIGGGAVELQATEEARNLLINNGKANLKVIRPETLISAADKQCTAALRVYLEPLFVSTFSIYLFGAGHVGRALVKVLEPLSCHLHWIDSRPDIFPAALAHNVHTVGELTPFDVIRNAKPDSYFLVMTHSHALDFEISEAVLQRGDFAYCGMIGSGRKLRQFEKYLFDRQQSPDLMNRLTSPMGIAGLDGREPAEIAIAIAAQLLQLRADPDAA